MMAALQILFGFLFTAGACLTAGKLLLRALRAPVCREEENPLGFVVGAALVSTAVFGLAAAGLARPAVFLAAGSAVFAAAVWKRVWVPAGKRLPALPPLWRWLCTGVFLVLGAVYAVYAMAPEVSPDGSAYHLGFVRLYLERGGMYPIYAQAVQWSLSQGMEMLFLPAFALGGHSAAALMHLAFLFALTAALTAYGRRFGYPAAGAFAAVLVFASPVVAVDAASAYTDVAVAAVAFATFYPARLWRNGGHPGWLVPMGLAAGFCYALKYNAFVAVPFALAVVGWKSRRGAVVVGACAALVAAPWAIKNWLWIGNPMAPFLNGLFPNPYVTLAFEKWYLEYNRSLPGIATRWEVPWQATVAGGLEGLLGPVFLLSPLALVALRRSEGRWLLAAGALFGIPCAFGISTRYAIPAVPFVAPAMGVAAHAVLAWPSVRDRYCDPNAWRLDPAPLRAALRLTPAEQYIAERIPQFPMVQMVERRVPKGGRVFVYAGLPQAYTSRELVVEWTAAGNKRLCDILWAPFDRALQPAWRWRSAPARRQVRKLRLVQRAEGRNAWSVSELRVYRGAGLLAPSPAWRLRAVPNPWNAQVAFDNTEVTRWSSAEAMRPGVSLELDFGRTEVIDGVAVYGTRDQEEARLEVETDPPGPALALEREVVGLPDLRREVAAEFKRAGVGYLLVSDGQWGAEDFRARTGSWGLEVLGETQGARLYRFR